MGNQAPSTASREDVVKFYDSLQNWIPEANRIDRVAKITGEEFITKYYNPQKPVILTNMMEDWPAFQKWTTEYIKSQIGEFDHTFWYEGKSMKMKISDYFDLAEKYIAEYHLNNNIDPQAIGFPQLPSQWEKIPYVRHFGPLHSKGKQLGADLKADCMFPEGHQVKMTNFLFVGLPGTKTEIHYDGTHNFVSIVKGQKHIALLPPGDHAKMFEGATEDQMKVWYTKTVFPMADPPELCMNLAKLAQDLKLNEVTPETKVPDTVKLMHQHPNLSRTEGLLYSPVHEGEIVFFPAYWFHYIHNTDLSYSITTQTYTREF
jgi:hypothetical protein